MLNGLRPVPRGIVKALLGDPDGVVALKQAFSDPAARREILSALAVIGHGGAGEDEILAGALADGAPEIRRKGVAVAAAIARRQAREITDGRQAGKTDSRQKPDRQAHAATLRAALADRSPDVRAAVLTEAASLPPAEAAAIVTLALRDSDPTLRRRAEEATEELAARAPAAVVEALADLMQSNDAGRAAGGAWRCSSPSRRTRRPPARPCWCGSCWPSASPMTRVSRPSISSAEPDRRPGAAAGAGESDPSRVFAAVAGGGAAALRPAGVAGRGRGDCA